MGKGGYHLVHGLEKGLAVLRALGAVGEGTTAQLATATGIPRPTVHRLIETLISESYVVRGQRRGTFRTGVLVKSLAEGYRDDDWITDIAHPVIRELYNEVVWPTDIATYSDGVMVIRASTHHRSPMSLHGTITGATFPMTESSVGLTYLAFSPIKERDTILGLVSKKPRLSRGASASNMATDRVRLDRVLAATRRRGYGIRRAHGNTRTSSIAVPIMHDHHVAACLCMIWIHSAMSVGAAVQRYLPSLRRAVERIERAYPPAKISK